MKKIEVLFTLMQDGKPVPVEKMMKTLNVQQGSIMCLISALRNDFGGDVVTERDGRKVLSYQLTNADKVKIPTKVAKVAKPKAAKVSVVKTKTVVNRKQKAVVTDDAIPTLEVEEVSDADLESLKAELGLSGSYSE
jgi:NMD protein affecting ribosome stability and mRNA decay